MSATPRGRRPKDRRGRTARTSESSVTAELGARLRSARQERGVGLRELARRIGVSPSLISQIETGKSAPSVSTLTNYATALELSLNEVFDVRPQAPDGDGGSAAPEARRPASPTPSPAGPPHEWVDAESSEAAGAGPVLRAGDGRVLRLESGVVWRRLTAGPEHGVAFMFVRYEPGGASTPSDSLLRHNGREYGYLLSGRLRITIGFDDFEVGPGDSFAFDCSQPHRFSTIGDEPAEAVWVIIDRGAGR